MSEFKVGLIGCGGIGAVHAQSWAQVPGAKVVAACDADPSRAEATGGEVYTDFQELLKRTDLDAVDICTPPHLHSAAAVTALKLGIPVICEKPLARNPAEALEIVTAAKESGTILMTAFCHRFHGPIEWVKEEIQKGTFGKVLMFRNRFGTRFKGVEDRWFANGEIAGGGTLMDTSIHSVDLFRHLVGEVDSVSSAITSYHPAITSVEDSAAMLLRSTDGAIGVIEASWMTPWSANVVEVYGEKGVAVVDYNTGETRTIMDGDTDWTPAPAPDKDRFVEELRHFVSVVREGAAPRVTGQDGLRAVEVIYQAYANKLA